MSMLNMPSSVNPITADIIASQSQDYVDEGLAEFQDQIQRLQGQLLYFYRQDLNSQLLLY